MQQIRSVCRQAFAIRPRKKKKKVIAAFLKLSYRIQENTKGEKKSL